MRKDSSLTEAEEAILQRINSSNLGVGGGRSRALSLQTSDSLLQRNFQHMMPPQPSMGDDEEPDDTEEALVREVEDDEEEDLSAQRGEGFYERDPYAEIDFQFEPNDVLAVVASSVTQQYAALAKGGKSDLVLKEIRAAKRLLKRKAGDSRQQDKWIFQVSMLAMLAKMYYFAHDPCGVFVLLNAFYAIFLVALRYFRFRKKGWHYYLLDFCYFGNLLTWALVLLGLENTHVFNTAYFFATGVLLFAIPTFRNSLILHSIDHMTSLYIHSQPAAVMTALRWSTNPNCPAKPDSIFSSLPFIVLFYLTWASSYYYANFVLLEKRIREQKYEVLFHTFKDEKRGLTGKIMNLCGGQHKPKLFMLIHALNTTATGCVAILEFHNIYINYIVVLGLLCLALSNGTNYYFQYFAKKYENSLQTLKQLEKDVKGAAERVPAKGAVAKKEEQEGAAAASKKKED